jgi:hypothetical protein
VVMMAMARVAARVARAARVTSGGQGGGGKGGVASSAAEMVGGTAASVGGDDRAAESREPNQGSQITGAESQEPKKDVCTSYQGTPTRARRVRPVHPVEVDLAVSNFKLDF